MSLGFLIAEKPGERMPPKTSETARERRKSEWWPLRDRRVGKAHALKADHHIWTCMHWRSTSVHQGRAMGSGFAIGSSDLAQMIRAACLQNETAPEKLLNRYEKRFENREKRSEKRSETRPKNVWPFSGRLKIFHRHFSTNYKSFSPPKI